MNIRCANTARLTMIATADPATTGEAWMQAGLDPVVLPAIPGHDIQASVPTGLVVRPVRGDGRRGHWLRRRALHSGLPVSTASATRSLWCLSGCSATCSMLSASVHTGVRAALRVVPHYGSVGRMQDHHGVGRPCAVAVGRRGPQGEHTRPQSMSPGAVTIPSCGGCPSDIPAAGAQGEHRAPSSGACSVFEE